MFRARKPELPACSTCPPPPWRGRGAFQCLQCGDDVTNLVLHACVAYVEVEAVELGSLRRLIRSMSVDGGSYDDLT